MAQEKKRRSVLLWSIFASLLLIVGAFAALFLFGDRFPEYLGEPLSRVRAIQDFMGDTVEKTFSKTKGLLGDNLSGDSTDPGQAPPSGGSRSYKVQQGDNLWSIARKGELVENPWDWHTILVQNRDKIDYALVSAHKGRWKVVVEPGEVLTVDPRTPRRAAGPVKKKYAVQLVSLEDTKLEQALKIVKTLIAGGQYAYLYRAEVDGKDWYRIRVGFFETMAQARAAGNTIKARYRKAKLFPDRYWIMIPPEEELRGEVLEFGAQRAKPWVIELRWRPIQKMALEDLRKVSHLGQFVYIAQKRQRGNRSFIYRTRIGFYATRAEAQTARTAAMKQIKLNWAGSGVVELRDFEEILPGQNVRLAEGS